MEIDPYRNSYGKRQGLLTLCFTAMNSAGHLQARVYKFQQNIARKFPHDLNKNLKLRNFLKTNQSINKAFFLHLNFRLLIALILKKNLNLSLENSCHKKFEKKTAHQTKHTNSIQKLQLCNSIAKNRLESVYNASSLANIETEGAQGLLVGEPWRQP